MSTPAKRIAGEPAARNARMAGALLLLAAIATMVMVYARVAADADQPTLLESLRAIAANTSMYTLAGAARVMSGITLAAAAWQAWRVTVIRERLGAPLVPYLFVASGVLTAASGVCALVLAAFVGDASEVTATATTEAVSTLRWVAGKLGFTAAGLALVAVGLRQWKAAGVIAPASVAVGVAMQLIWVDSATIVHRITGPAFFVWLVVVGVLLLTGAVERRFSAMHR